MPLWRFYSHVVAPRPWLGPALFGYRPPAGFGLRRKAVDGAALHTRQFSGSPQRPTMLRMAVEAGVAGIGLQARAKCQLCVPAVATISALWTRRSTSDTTQAALGNTSRHSAKGRLVVIS